MRLADHVGQLRPGLHAADMVAVEADPLADDHRPLMRTLSLVVQGGRVVRDGLDTAGAGG